MTPQNLKGSCLCGKVTYQVTLPPTPEIGCCFCGDCRKSSASLFDAYVIVPKTSFEILSGEGNLTTFSLMGDAGFPVPRIFCRECGSRIYGSSENPEYEGMFDGAGVNVIGIGTLDVPPEIFRKWKKGRMFFEEQQTLISID